MHPALYSWREELPSLFMRACAYLGGLVVLSIVAAQVFQSRPSIEPINSADHRQWIDIERPFPAFALDIPEAAGAPAGYAAQRHVNGGGRKDIMTRGDAAAAAPFLEVEIYRPGGELRRFATPQDTIVRRAEAAGSVSGVTVETPLPTKFGPFSVAAFDIPASPARHCLGFVRDFAEPALQIAGRFCQGGEVIERTTLACALDRLTLLSAGSEARLGGLFAKAELNRNFCGERDPILAPTPKYKLLWRALAARPEPRRTGR